MINSKFADMKNTGGRNGGSITAAQFLQRFVDKTPWAHLDIAGTGDLFAANEINRAGLGLGRAPARPSGGGLLREVEGAEFFGRAGLRLRVNISTTNITGVDAAPRNGWRRDLLDGGCRASPLARRLIGRASNDWLYWCHDRRRQSNSAQSRSWPEEDQDELAEVAREIEARRTGVYELSEEERAALDEALRSRVASDEDVAAFWKRHGIK